MRYQDSFILNNYPDLVSYIQDENRGREFDYSTFNCSLGPNGSFYINNSGTGEHYGRIDDALDKELKRRLDKIDWVGDPSQVTLGVGGAFVLVGKKGDLFWDLKGNYEKLDKELQETKQGLQVSATSKERNHR
jgi:hypothetical protein